MLLLKNWDDYFFLCCLDIVRYYDFLGNTLEQRCLDESSGETNYINAVEEEDDGTNNMDDIQGDKNLSMYL